MSYMQYLQDYIMRQEPGQPIYTEQLATVLATEFEMSKENAAAATAVAVKRLIEGAAMPELRKYQKGIYYLTVMTKFGELGISKEKLIADKYLLPDKGYETGPILLHRMGLTTQMPAEHLIATNVAKECVRYDARLGIHICPPKVTINADNKKYLQTLDALEILDKAPVDADDPYVIVANHIDRNKLQYETLLYYADRYYNRKTVINLAHTAGKRRIENEAAQR